MIEQDLSNDECADAMEARGYRQSPVGWWIYTKNNCIVCAKTDTNRAMLAEYMAAADRFDAAAACDKRATPRSESAKNTEENA